LAVPAASGAIAVAVRFSKQALLVLSSTVERPLPRDFNITTVDPSVAGSSAHSYPLVDRDADEPPAIRPSSNSSNRYVGDV
jgi:hypothetical protein